MFIKLIFISSIAFSFFNHTYIAQPVDDFNLLNYSNRTKFAKFLYKSGDYLRAIDELNAMYKLRENDRLLINVADCYFRMNQFERGRNVLRCIDKSSSFQPEVNFHLLRLLLKSEEYGKFEKRFYQYKTKPAQVTSEIGKLKFYNSLFLRLKNNNKLTKIFSTKEELSIAEYFKNKIESIEQKSPLLASMYSAVIPGTGKIYTQNYGDGITAFVAVALLSYLSYTNFKADHKFRAWTFAGMSTLFYAGNIYGSYKAAEIFNFKLESDISSEIKNYLNKINYFFTWL